MAKTPQMNGQLLVKLEDEIALVTGASRGIGKAIALTLGQAGASVIGTATSQQGAQDIDLAFTDNQIVGEGQVLDVNETGAISDLVKKIGKSYRPPSILVNNAGISRDNLLIRMKSEEWDQVISTNLSSIYHLSKSVLYGMMRQRKGRIINIASVIGAMGNPGQTNYAAAKAGMMGFTKSLAREAGAFGITVNAIAPGFIETDMTRTLNEKQRQALIGQTPLKRLGSVEELAQVALFLSGPGAAYITGETIHVNGGLYMA